jgi:hypothetical protein
MNINAKTRITTRARTNKIYHFALFVIVGSCNSMKRWETLGHLSEYVETPSDCHVRGNDIM